MKRIVIIVVFMLCTIGMVGCQKHQESDNPNDEPYEEIGASGMTVSEIRTIAENLEIAHKELYYWLNTGSSEDYDESLAPIPDNDGVNHFNWRAVKKYTTIDELYSAFEEIFSPTVAKDEFNVWATEQQGFLDNEDNTDWNTFTYSIFKEIDGRLYKRDISYVEISKELIYNFETLEIVEETEDRIIIAVKMYIYSDTITPDIREMIFVNNVWRFNSYAWSPK